MNEQIQFLNKAWQHWETECDYSLAHDYQRFGQYFINNFTVRGYKNPSIFYETNNDKAYTELLWEIASGELDNKIVSEYTTETNQKGSA
jgi:membrane-bound lytic murein transglycosylase MltF